MGIRVKKFIKVTYFAETLQVYKWEEVKIIHKLG
jgi:hypothetical protein